MYVVTKNVVSKNVISNPEGRGEKSTNEMEGDTPMDPHASFHSAQDDNTPMDFSAMPRNDKDTTEQV